MPSFVPWSVGSAIFFSRADARDAFWFEIVSAVAIEINKKLSSILAPWTFMLKFINCASQIYFYCLKFFYIFFLLTVGATTCITRTSIEQSGRKSCGCVASSYLRLNLLRLQRYRLSTDDNLNSLREVRVRSQKFWFWRLEESLNNKN